MAETKRRAPMIFIAIAVGLFLVFVLAEMGGLFKADKAQKQTNGWLLNAGSEEQRLELIQKHMRGFDVTMWETGERYERLHEAVQRGNYRMAVYQWDKIGQTIANGIERRPRWGAAADELFFPTYKDVRAGLQSGDEAQARRAFEQAKASCMGCHQGSGVGHMNDQPLFELSGGTPKLGAR
jgi:hypothetical protein